MKQIIVTILLITFVFTSFPTVCQAQDQPPKKKGRMWLIPVLAGAGFAAGMFIGFSKFDQSINAEKKIWNSAIVGAAAGGIAGWFIGRPRTERSQDYGLPVHKFELRRKDQDFAITLDTKSISLDSKNTFNEVKTDPQPVLRFCGRDTGSFGLYSPACCIFDPEDVSHFLFIQSKTLDGVDVIQLVTRQIPHL